MSEKMSAEQRAQFAVAVAHEVKAEMGRKDVDSVRELARRTGLSHTSINDRLYRNPRTKKPTVINVKDLAAYALALGVEPGVFLQRAKAAMSDAPAPVSYPIEQAPAVDDESPRGIRERAREAREAELNQGAEVDVTPDETA